MLTHIIIAPHLQTPSVDVLSWQWLLDICLRSAASVFSSRSSLK
jgi:hypothetical protein